MAGNALGRHAQAGGSPYDEEDYMRIPLPRREPQMGGGTRPSDEDLKAMAGMRGRFNVNDFLNERLRLRTSPAMQDYLIERELPSPSTMPTDMNMMRIYGPEDEVAYDSIGHPIPLNDPRHPRNQTPGNALAPFGYPQRR